MAHRIRGVTVAGLSPPPHLSDGARLWWVCYRQGFRLRDTGVSVLTSLAKPSVGLTCLPPLSVSPQATARQRGCKQVIYMR